MCKELVLYLLIKFYYKAIIVIYSLMKAAQDVHLPKKIMSGGGLREFILSEMHIFEGIEEPLTFFTMQERQTLILYILNTLRVQNCDWLPELVQSQPLSIKLVSLFFYKRCMIDVVYFNLQLLNVFQME